MERILFFVFFSTSPSSSSSLLVLDFYCLWWCVCIVADVVAVWVIVGCFIYRMWNLRPTCVCVLQFHAFTCICYLWSNRFMLMSRFVFAESYLKRGRGSNIKTNEKRRSLDSRGESIHTQTPYPATLLHTRIRWVTTFNTRPSFAPIVSVRWFLFCFYTKHFFLICTVYD